ncbi:MAG: UvrD-helicase domain-containing protein [Bacteroidales bacterium]|nr:UvrD-helicase domain-containing protein [Bacteroidales bacterium]
MDRFLKDLNEVQYQAVCNTEGPTLVIAGAGSGKTRVLTYRVAYLLSKGVSPSVILCLTFTNKAAAEMKERIGRLVGNDLAKYVWMGTFHSIFARILRSEAHATGYSANYTIYDTVDSKSLIRSVIKEMNLDDQLYKPGDVLGRISWAKNNLITPAAYKSNSQLMAHDNSTRRPQLGTIYATYCARCRNADAMDFDDLLLNTNILFRDFPDVLEKYQKRFAYVLVDEYQDTNYSQYLIVNKLASEHQNVCVVGDDAQSIYSFRGAKIENILNFRNDYPDYKLYKLEQNYRSTQTIVKAANSVIAKNQGQIRKTVWSGNETGCRISIQKVLTDIEEGFFVSNSILDTMLSEQQQYYDFAILYRTNAQSRIFEEALRKRNIPYKIYGGIGFYQRKEIKDMLAYLRLSVNHNDDEALKRIINYPPRGIGDVTMEKLGEIAANNRISLWKAIENLDIQTANLNKGTIGKLNAFRQLISEFTALTDSLNAYEATHTIAVKSGLLKDLYNGNTVEERSRYENLEELMNGIKEFTDACINENRPSGIAGFLENVSLLTDQDNEKDGDRNKVSIMTMHSAKGLEFNNVYIAGVEEEIFPSRLSVNSPQELEEERRLFYVALTRSKKRVIITYAQNRYRWGTLMFTSPSRFLRDIDPEFVDWQAEEANEPPVKKTENAASLYGASTVRVKKLKAVRPGNHLSPGVVKPDIIRKRAVTTLVSEDDFIPDNPDEIVAGMQVEHRHFGPGEVISVEGAKPNRKAKVHFPRLGEEKQLLLKFAKLRIKKR